MRIDIDLLLTWGATYKQVQRDEIIFQEGGHGNFYYQVISSRVRWVSINEDSREFIQFMVDKGESFGEFPLFDDGPYAATALAYYNPEHRINTLLTYFKTNNKHTCPKCKQIRLTRQQIADMTGLRVETVIRAMRHLHKKGTLFIEKGKVYCQ